MVAVAQAFEQSSCLWLESAIFFESGFCKRVNVDRVVCVTAPLELRIQRVMQRVECSEKKAATIVRDGDERRAAYYEFYTGKTRGHGFSYHLCVNSSLLGIDATADFLCQFVEAKQSRPCEE